MANTKKAAEANVETVEAPKELTQEEKVAKWRAAENAKMHELVEFEAWYDGDKYKDDILVGWEDQIYRIKRGETVMIPRGVLNIIKRSKDQDTRAARLIAENSGVSKMIADFGKS